MSLIQAEPNWLGTAQPSDLLRMKLKNPAGRLGTAFSWLPGQPQKIEYGGRLGAGSI